MTQFIENKAIMIVVIFLIAVVIRLFAIYTDNLKRAIKNNEVIVSVLVFIASTIATIALFGLLNYTGNFKSVVILIMVFSIIVAATDLFWAIYAFKQSTKMAKNYLFYRPALSLLWLITVLYQIYQTVVLY